MLDTTLHHETPEGAVIVLHPAGAPVRALAWFIDAVIRWLLITLLALLSIPFGGLGVGLTLLAMFLINWFYNVAFEVTRGATPGKKRMGLRVVNDNGTPITWSASILRNLLRVVDVLPVGYALGLIWSLFHPEAKRLGDVAAGTLVVYREDPVNLQLPEKLEQLTPAKPNQPLDYATQQAVMGFAERSAWLSPQRQVELAEILQPLHQQQGEAATQTLLAYAKGIAGKQ